MIERKQLEKELLSLQETVVGEEPRSEYQKGFRDGIQHAISVGRGVDDE